METFMNHISDQFTKLKEKSISVPVSEDLLFDIIANFRIKAVKIMSVTIESETLIIKGEIRKYLLSIPYSITLVPNHVVGRRLFFNIVKINPLNIKGLNNIIFNKHSHLTCDNNMLGVDLNQIDQIKMIKIGNIKDFTISKNTILLSIGL